MINYHFFDLFTIRKKSSCPDLSLTTHSRIKQGTHAGRMEIQSLSFTDIVFKIRIKPIARIAAVTVQLMGYE